ncbi:MAG: putative DNA binding domain-containing protein [Methanocorpusculum sp.]|nr:putative DNA binding domain-containing protein [Methanocorpusculum sp.]
MMENSFVESLLAQTNLPLPICCKAEFDKESVARTVCAYLNANGGWIVLGVDEKHRYVGLPVGNVETLIQREVVEGIVPLPLVYVQRELFDGSPVVLITVMKGSLGLYTYNGKYYVMAGETAVQPDSDRMSRLLRDSLPVRSGWEGDSCLMAEVEDLDEELMADVYEKGLKKGRITESSDGLRSTLSDIRLMTVSKITNGAVALFAKETRSLLPQCRIRIQLMLKGKAASQFDDTYTIEGNIFTALEQTISYFKDRLPRVSLFYADKTGRYDDLVYPLDVIDEAVSNALIHRDYTDRMDEVTVFIYADRMEITNSGQLPKQMVSGKSKVLPHGSVLRNPLMAEVFYISGEMEKTGRGMQLISGKMQETGKRLPEWASRNGKTTLCIYNLGENVSQNVRVSQFRDSHQKGMLFSKADYMTAFEKEVSKGTAQNDLLLMLKAGICEKVGSGPQTKYRLR